METKALELGSHQVGGSLSVCHVDSVVPGHEGMCGSSRSRHGVRKMVWDCVGVTQHLALRKQASKSIQTLSER
ncbi:hypothetical protein PPTG_23165 [Phytophthora nicotianae INRA-310]|uniref:Uncharacterized protein n=1 Tax=Phytophthora nicotianae (strain INRA-310) TaxID=761204 RepID=W2Q4D5_PHYN3|nr:hypothetical protein PPTG_23165 [Phytophthora nicotianae INRA-310]ETN07731.1 hypothetical protein PPTG_23165 [Phytophthora nicotianae INRA-310]